MAIKTTSLDYLEGGAGGDLVFPPSGQEGAVKGRLFNLPGGFPFTCTIELKHVEQISEMEKSNQVHNAASQRFLLFLLLSV